MNKPTPEPSPPWGTFLFDAEARELIQTLFGPEFMEQPRYGTPKLIERMVGTVAAALNDAYTKGKIS